MGIRVKFTESERRKWQQEVTRHSATECPVVLGWLLGEWPCPDVETLTVISSVAAGADRSTGGITPWDDSMIQNEAQQLMALLPGGISLIGCYGSPRSSLEAATPHATRLRSALQEKRNLGANDMLSKGDKDPFAIIEVSENGSDIRAFELHENTMREVSWELLKGGADELWSSFWGSHCLISFSVSFCLQVLSATGEDFESAAERAIAAVEKSILSPSATWILRFISGSGQQAKLSSAVVSLASPSDTLLAGLLGNASPLVPGSKGKDSSPASLAKKIPNPVLATLVTAGSTIVSSGTKNDVDAATASAPDLEFYSGPEGARIHNRRLQLRALACAPLSMSITTALEHLLAPSAAQQLRAAKSMMVSLSKTATVTSDPKICAYNFCPEGFVHPITALYSLAYGEAEAVSVEQRKSMHQRLGLPLDRPLIRISNALSLILEPPASAQASASKGTGSKRLQNVHIGLPPSGISGGKVWQVQGLYDYYHYMQDRIDDSGWGCAYRSLQTIISWFRHQQYTTVPVPSHRKVQETLVGIGDKSPEFVGSSQWIGAIELSFVLDTLLGVSCKVLTVQSGADMPLKARELARHFDTQGTPVMIGGGVLAYTLLGIDYNELTGECAFLILDPHYTAGEDLKSIRNGGWVGWKKTVTAAGKDFFVRDAFYNLLLPQRPQTV